MDFMEKNFGKMTFARALKANRMAASLKQVDLAKLAQVSTQAISQFENGRDFPSAETAHALAKALKLDSRMYELLIVQDMIARKGFHGIEVILKKVS